MKLTQLLLPRLLLDSIFFIMIITKGDDDGEKNASASTTYISQMGGVDVESSQPQLLSDLLKIIASRSDCEK